MDGFVLAMDLSLWIILLVLGVVLVFVIKAMMGGGKKKPATAPLVDLANLSIREASRGDMVTVLNASPDYEDLTFQVERIHRYEWGREKWYELAGRSPHGEIALEFQEDDGLSIYLALGKSHRIEEVQTQGATLTEDDLVRFDEERSSGNTVQFDDRAFRYEASHEVGFFEDGVGEGEGFYVWDFEGDDGKKSLSIEKWEGEAFEVFLTDIVDPSDVQVFRS